MKINNTEVYSVYSRLLPPLLYMQHRGVRVDVDAIKRDSALLSDHIAKRQDQLNSIVGFEMNIKSPKQKQDYFYGTKHLAPYKDRKTGSVTCDEEALKRIARRGFIEADIIIEMVHAAKLQDSYLGVTLSADSRLRSAFGFTRGGRLTSGQDIFGEGLNMQTLPHPRDFWKEPNQPSSGVELTIDFRSYILADEGYMLYNIDEAQAENRLVAYIAPDINMIDAFEQGIDIHKRTAALIFDKPVDKISSADGSCNLGNGTRSERYFGKEANHALNYGLGVKHFALRLEIPEAQAAMIRDKYFAGYPGVRLYHNWVLAKLRKDRTLVNLFGRAYNFLDRVGEDTLSDALYFIPQSTVADIINRRGILEVWDGRTGFYEGFDLLNQVHDAIMFQIPIDLGVDKHWSMIHAVIESLQQPLFADGRKFSIPSDLKVGKCYARMDELKGKRVNKEEFVKLFNKYKDEK